MGNAIAGGGVATESRVRNVVLWVLQIGLAAQFLMTGFLKISGNQTMVDMFADIGAGQWLRFVTGGLEIAGAIGLLIPVLSGLAALGLTGLMVGATLTNLFIIDENPTFPIVFLVVAVVIVWGRRSRITALAAKLRR